MKGRGWLVARVSLTALTFLSTLIGPHSNLRFFEDPDPVLGVLGVVLLVGFQVLVWPVMFLFVLGIQALNPRSARTWVYPTWHDNPFDFSQPLRFFHMVVFMMAAAAIGAALSALWQPFEPVWDVGGPLGMALGGWLGLQVVWRVCAWKHQ